MPEFEVEVSFKVKAENEDDAANKVRDWLNTLTVSITTGISDYYMYDNCATEWDDSNET